MKKIIETDQYLGWECSELVFWAFRYFLGRMTIETRVFADRLANSYWKLDEKQRNIIKQELDRGFELDDASRKRGDKFHPLGMDCDRDAWEGVRTAYRKEGGL